MNNPYATPEALLSGRGDGADETYVPKIFSFSGRVGRLRYLAYTFGVTVLLSVVFGVLDAVSGDGIIGSLLSIISGLLIAVAGVAIGRRRLHDLDKTGWLMLIMFVPLLNIVMGLYLMFARGTEGGNRFGPAPAPNSRGVVALACVLPLVFMIGIVAAVAIPAYHDYTYRANASAVLSGDR